MGKPARPVRRIAFDIPSFHGIGDTVDDQRDLGVGRELNLRTVGDDAAVARKLAEDGVTMTGGTFDLHPVESAHW
jgi:hypothetical protein